MIGFSDLGGLVLVLAVDFPVRRVEPAMSDTLETLILDLLGSVILGSIFVGPMLIVLIGRNHIRRRGLHHAAANETFLADNRAEHTQDSRTSEAPPAALTPHVRQRLADADTPRPSASASYQRSQL